MPQIGTLRDRVQLQRKDTVAEAEGGHAVSYASVATVWARVTSLKGRIGREADARAARISHTVVMRFRTDIGAGDRIVYRGRNLEIQSADDLNGKRAFLNCACRETEVTG